MSYRWWSSCQSNTGQRRKINEDASLASPEAGLWVVADGMGGHARGDKASQMVIEAFANFPQCPSLDSMVEQAHRCLQQANANVYVESQRLGERQIMGSTVVVLLARKQHFACLWVGDSRSYRLRKGELTQLTKDHSVVQEMLDNGEITSAQAKGHPASSRITRAVGASTNLVVDDIRGDIADGDRVLLCSDGLTLEVNDTEIAFFLSELDCESATDELMALSLARGARDNVTVGVVQFEETTGFDEWAEDDITETTAVNYELRKRRVMQAPA